MSAADPALAALIDRGWRLRTPRGDGNYFATLARSIMFQQLAGRAAAAIHARFVTAIGGSVTPEAVLATSPEELRAAGLSGNKTAAVLDLATKATDGTVPLAELNQLDDEEIIARLSAVRGIGRWTAEMFLMFELRRPDVWPVDDFGVRSGWTLMHRCPRRSNRARFGRRRALPSVPQYRGVVLLASRRDVSQANGAAGTAKVRDHSCQKGE